MKKPIILYGLRHKVTKKPLAVYAISNEGADDAVSISYKLQEYCTGDQLWLVDNKESVQHVLLESTPWYNASYPSPEYSKNMDEYEIFTVEVCK